VPDRAISLTIDHVNEAKEILIRRQDTHLDSLAERLREPRVRSNSKEEFAQRGNEIYETHTRSQVEAENHGKIVAIFLGATLRERH
jgi:hypothetical protein